MTELVLLVEPDGKSWKLRTWTLKQPYVNKIIENGPFGVREWECKQGETDESGTCRIFREVLAPIVEPVEKPLYDELVLKTPLSWDGKE